jgi:hypothetical protein
MCGEAARDRQDAYEHRRKHCMMWRHWKLCGEVHSLGRHGLRGLQDIVRRHVGIHVAPPRGNEDAPLRNHGSIKGAYWEIMRTVFCAKTCNMSVRVSCCGKVAQVRRDARRVNEETGEESHGWYWESVDVETAVQLVHAETMRVLRNTVTEMLNLQQQSRVARLRRTASDPYRPPLTPFWMPHVVSCNCASMAS